MRRDLVRWFLFGMFCSAVIVVVVAVLRQDLQTALTALCIFYGLLLIGLIIQRYRRRTWRRLWHDENFYSHEMRCQMARNLRGH